MNKKHIGLYIICAACACVFTGAAAFNVDLRGQAASNYAELEEEVVSLRDPVERTMPEPDAGATEEEEEEEDPFAWDGDGAELDIDFKKLLKKNDDTIAWLHVPVVDISYPVLYYPYDNDYYLNRSFDGTYSSAGVIYLEYTNKPDFSEKNSFLYGHNMGDGTMFGSLHHIAGDKEGCAEYPYFYLYYPGGEVRRYLIFSFYETQTGSATYFVPETNRAYDEYVKERLKLAQSKPEEEWEDSLDTRVEQRAPVVTMSTCHGPAGTTRRFVVHGILDGIHIPEEKADEVASE